MARAFVFPGQGSQAVGMGRELAAAFPTARDVFDEVDEALDEKLSRLMFEGPEEELTLTANAQPALMTLSLAITRVLQKDAGIDFGTVAKLVAGHSLGEYTALAAVGAFSLSDAARLLRRRGLAMQQAVPVGEGAMAALLGLDLDAAREVALQAVDGESGWVCDAANDNAPGQVVVSGHKAAVERAVKLAAARGAKRAMMLAVSAPFHCALMRPAAEAMAEALGTTSMATPTVPVVANVTATAVSDVDSIRRLLVDQVTGLVRWREGVLFMKDEGVDQLVEIGSGKVLTGLTRRIDPKLSGIAIQTPADIDAFVKAQ